MESYMQVLGDRALVDEGDTAGRQRLLTLALGDVPELLRVVLPHTQYTCGKHINTLTTRGPKHQHIVALIAINIFKLISL